MEQVDAAQAAGAPGVPDDAADDLLEFRSFRAAPRDSSEQQSAASGAGMLGAVRPLLGPESARLGAYLTPTRHAHRVPWRQQLSLAAWSALLASQYALTRLACRYGIPHDCHADTDQLEVMHDFQVMFNLGFVLAVLTGVHMQDRFGYLFCLRRPRPRGVAFLAVFLLGGPAFGALDRVELLTNFSLTSAALHGGFNTVLLVAVAVGAAFLVLWHLWYAFKHNPVRGFLTYTSVRAAILVFYSIYLAAASDEGSSVHLHHYVVGFLCASLAEFNHPLSLLLLAGGTAVMVQGISAYDADPVVVRPLPLAVLEYA